MSFDNSRSLNLNNMNCVGAATIANLIAGTFLFGGQDFLTLLATTNENQTNTNFLSSNLTAGSIVNTNLTNTNITSTNIVNTNITSSNIVTTSITSTNVNFTNTTTANIFVAGNNTSGGLRIGENTAINCDSDPASRLSIVKKSGSPPSIAIANNSVLTFTVANSSSANLVSANTYSTIAQLSTAGILNTTAFQQVLPRINTSTSRNNWYIFNTVSGNFIHNINTVSTSPNMAPMTGLGAINTNYSAGTRWDSSSGTSPLFRTPPGPGLYEIKYNGCLDAYTTGTLNWDLFDVTNSVTRSSLNTIDISKERTWNLNMLFTSGNHTNLYCPRVWMNSGTSSSSQTTFSIRVIERWS
jgi:hypothetical protein